MSIANGIPQEWILGLLFKIHTFLFVSFIKHMMKHGGSDSFCKHPQLCNWSNPTNIIQFFVDVYYWFLKNDIKLEKQNPTFW